MLLVFSFSDDVYLSLLELRSTLSVVEYTDFCCV